MKIADRIYLEMVEANRRLAAAGIAAETSWTEANARTLARAIVATGRKQGRSDSVIIVSTHGWIERIIAERVSANMKYALFKGQKWWKRWIDRIMLRAPKPVSPAIRLKDIARIKRMAANMYSACRALGWGG